jgi:excisionase family DNA binding protein
MGTDDARGDRVVSSHGPLPFAFRQLLTMAQAGAYLQKSGEATRIYLRRNQVPMSKVGRQWRIDKRDLDRHIEDCTAAAMGKAHRKLR